MNDYSSYSNTQLHSMFSSNIWNTLSFENKVCVCQEVENRYALSNEVTPCTIQTKQVNGGIYGYQSGNTITLNESLLKNGTFTQSYTDSSGSIQTREIPVIAPNWNTLDTIYHEGTHGIQEATERMPYTYIKSETDASLYRIQGIEKEAFAMGQLKTLEAISDVEQYYGTQDSTQQDYIEYVKIDSFKSALEDSISNYNDPNIEQTLNDVIQDRDQGIYCDNSSASYQAINLLCDNQYYISCESSYVEPTIEDSSLFYNDTVSIQSSAMDGSSSFYDDTITQSTELSQTNEGLISNDYGI